MSCYSCGGNPNTFCGECITSKDTWISLVDTLPDPFMGDLDHLFRTPEGNLYALSPDRTKWIRVNGESSSDYSKYVTIGEYNKVKGALEKLLTDLKDSGAWKQTGDTIFEGELYHNRHIITNTN